MCKFGVHQIRSIFTLLPNASISLLILPLLVQIVRGVPLSEQSFGKSFNNVRVSVFFTIFAVGHLLKRSNDTKILTYPCVLESIGPTKSN